MVIPYDDQIKNKRLDRWVEAAKKPLDAEKPRLEQWGWKDQERADALAERARDDELLRRREEEGDEETDKC